MQRGSGEALQPEEQIKIAYFVKKDNTTFDASQYEFFGKNVVEHDLEELDHNMDAPPKAMEDQNLLSSGAGKNMQGKNVKNASSVDDLVYAFAKLNRISDPRNPNCVVDSGMVFPPMKLPSMPQPVVPQVYYYERLSGFIKSFYNERGYGFIRSHYGGNDIFVHYSSVKSDGCIQMWAGMQIEYEVVGHESKLQAINVTGPGGILLKGRKRVSLGERSSTRSCNSDSANYLNVGPCFNCGRFGHLAKNCYPTQESVLSVPDSKALGTKPVKVNSGVENGGGLETAERLPKAWCGICLEAGHLPRNCIGWVRGK